MSAAYSMRRCFLAVITLWLSAGCGAADDSPGPTGPSGGSNGLGGSSNMAGDAPVAIDLGPQLGVLDARARIELPVQVQPARVHRVLFALPHESPSGGEVDPRDAVLDRSEVDTDAAGRAIVVLRAPSAPTTFTVRASIGSLIAWRDATVLEPATATLLVRPVNLGHRKPTTWRASVHAGKTCAQVPGVPPEDAVPFGLAPADGAPEVTGVPTGETLAVTLRSGFFMGGCETVEMLPPEAADAPREVSVGVRDRPLELQASNLSVSFGLSDPIAAWAEMLEGASASVLSGLHGSTGTSDADALLDAMQAELSASTQQSFLNARIEEEWDELVLERWGSPTRLTDVATSWLDGGAARWTAGDDMLLGRLRATDGGKANLTLDMVAAMPAQQAGFVPDAQVTWSAAPDDTVSLSAEVYFFGSRLVTALAEPTVLSDYPDAEDVGQALALALDCEALGDELAAAGNDSQLAFSGCDGACVAQLCRDGLAVMWERARQSEAPARLSVAATGEARVGEEAQLAGLKGNWVGKLLAGGGEKPTGGLVNASEPLEAP